MPKPSSPVSQSTLTHTSSWTARFRSPETVLETPTDYNEEDSNSGSGSDSGGSDDEVEVEDFLWGAQMDLIAHRNSQAVSKLQQAVALESSAACATLGNLLSRGLRSHAHSNAVSPLHPPPGQPCYTPQGMTGSLPCDVARGSLPDGLAAARLFAKGLELELSKPVERPRDSRSGRSRAKKEQAGTAGGLEGEGTDGSYGSASEEEGAEGDYFGLERALDLVIGLTDSYRFGVFSDSQHESDTEHLWTRGPQLAKRTLRHPAVAWATPTTRAPAVRLSASPTSSPTRPSTAARAISTTHSSAAARNSSLLDHTARAASPRRTPAVRSYSHPSTSLSAIPAHFPSSVTHHHLSPNLKLRLTIQIHCLYLLALQIWPTDQIAAQEHWLEILRVSEAAGGVVGTKEGDEIVLKATQRLKALQDIEPDTAWKLSKRRKDGSSPAAVVEAFESMSPTRDALVDIWREKLENLRRAKGKGKARELSEERDGERGSSSITIRPNGQDATGRGSSAALPWAISTSSASTVTPSTARFGSRPSKFHFASAAEYPSPPDTPLPSPPGTHRSSDADLGSDFPHPAPSTITSLTPATSTAPSTSSHTSVAPSPSGPTSTRRPFRRMASTSSFQPPRLLSRVQSSASVSTLPPNFGSLRTTPWPLRTTTSLAGPPSRFALDPSGTLLASESAPNRGRMSGWTSGVRQRLSSLNPFRSEVGKPNAMAVLKNVLKRDDESAGPGMYWADTGEAESEEDEEEELSAVEEESSPPPVLSAPRFRRDASTSTAPSTPRQHHDLRPRRSFVDPTTARSAVASPTPRVTCTPPTPDKLSEHLHPHAPSLLRTLNKSPAVDIDPLFLELERKSRVGVRTKCSTCGKKGLNFPACPRCKTTYCSRSCRISEEGGGDGTRHVCETEDD